MHTPPTVVNDNRTGLSLGSNFSWTLAGNVIYAACQWGMLVMLAKLGTPAMLGQYALGLSVTAPVIMLTNLQLRGIQATDARHEYEFRHYFVLRLVTTGLALLIIGTLVLVSGYRLTTAVVVLLIGLAKACEAISDVFYGLLQKNEYMDRIAKSMMIKGPLSLVALTVGVYITHSTIGGAIGLAGTWMLLLICYDVPNGLLVLQTQPARPFTNVWRHLVHPTPDRRVLRTLAWHALPLGIVLMLNSLNTNIPRYLIERYTSEQQLGIYAALAYVLIAGYTVIDALGQSASPRLAKYYMVGNIAAFRSLLIRMLGLAAALASVGILGALVAGQEVIRLLYRPEYAQFADVFVWLMVATAPEYVASILGHGLTAARYFRVQVPLNIIFVSIVFVAALWLVPRYGLLGAAWATCLSFTVQVVLKSMVLLFVLHSRPANV